MVMNNYGRAVTKACTVTDAEWINMYLCVYIQTSETDLLNRVNAHHTHKQEIIRLHSVDNFFKFTNSQKLYLNESIMSYTLIYKLPRLQLPHQRTQVKEGKSGMQSNVNDIASRTVHCK